MNTMSIVTIVIVSLCLAYSLGAFVFGIVKRSIQKKKTKKELNEEFDEKGE